MIQSLNLFRSPLLEHIKLLYTQNRWTNDEVSVLMVPLLKYVGRPLKRNALNKHQSQALSKSKTIVQTVQPETADRKLTSSQEKPGKRSTDHDLHAIWHFGRLKEKTITQLYLTFSL